MKRRSHLVDESFRSAALPEAIGESEAFLEFQQRVSRVAPVDRPILVVGERGTGKELVAGRLHYLSKRWQGPLVALNCAALAPTLLETELFGYEAGAFTGAVHRRVGRFEAADGGTLFLDEIGLIPMEVQEKLLRAVEYGVFERVGSSEPVEVNARIVGATNADLPRLARDGKFKIDLLDRLSFEVLVVPPLRERKGDILLLAQHFAARMAHELGRPEAPAFGEEACAGLERYSWPGNVRELKNVVERAVYRCEGGVVRSLDLDPFASPFVSAPARSEEAQPPAKAEAEPFTLEERSLTEAVTALEIRALRGALVEARFHQGRAAELLGISYNRFRVLFRRHRARLKFK